MGHEYEESMQLTSSWLYRHGVHQIQPGRHGDYIFATASLDRWSHIFGKNFSAYENSAGKGAAPRVLHRLRGLGSQHVKASAHVIGTGLGGSVNAVFGLSDFIPTIPRLQPSSLDEKCNQVRCA